MRPLRRGEVGLVDVDLPRGVHALRVDAARAAVAALVGAATTRRLGVVLHVAGRGAVADDEAVVEDRRLLRGAEDGLPVVVAVLARRPVAGDDGHRHEGLEVLELVPDAHGDVGEVARRRPEAQRHRRPGRHGPERHPVGVAPAVVGQARLVDLAVGRQRHLVRNGHDRGRGRRRRGGAPAPASSPARLAPITAAAAHATVRERTDRPRRSRVPAFDMVAAPRGLAGEPFGQARRGRDQADRINGRAAGGHRGPGWPRRRVRRPP